MKTTALVALAAMSSIAQAAPPPQVAVQAVTDGQITAATIKLVTFMPKDSFDTPPVADFAGKTFVIDAPVSEFAFDTFRCQSTWTYGNDGVLSVSVQEGLASTYTMLRGPGAPLTGAATKAYSFRPFVCSSKSTNSSGSNAYGAQVEIRHRETTVIGLSKPAQRAALKWSRAVSPDEGRALAKALRVRLTGTVGSWGPGGSIGCVRDHSDATFSAPLEDDTTMCVVKVENLRTDLIDSRTGEVLATELPTDGSGLKDKKHRR